MDVIIYIERGRVGCLLLPHFKFSSLAKCIIMGCEKVTAPTSDDPCSTERSPPFSGGLRFLRAKHNNSFIYEKVEE